MSKAISLDAIITGVSSRADRSLGLRVATPELSESEAVTILRLQHQNVKMLIQPVDAAPEELVHVAKQLNMKTASQRLRGVLFLRYQKERPDEIFETFYARIMESIIEEQKRKLDQ